MCEEAGWPAEAKEVGRNLVGRVAGGPCRRGWDAADVRTEARG